MLVNHYKQFNLPIEILIDILSYLPIHELWSIRKSSRNKLQIASETAFLTKIKHENIQRFRVNATNVLSRGLPLHTGANVKPVYSLNIASFRTTCTHCDGFLCSPWLCQYSLDYAGYVPVNNDQEKEGKLEYSAVPLYHSSILVCSSALSTGRVSLWARFFEVANPDACYRDLTITLPSSYSINGIYELECDGFRLTFSITDDVKNVGSEDIDAINTNSGKRLQVFWLKVTPSFRVNNNN